LALAAVIFLQRPIKDGKFSRRLAVLLFGDVGDYVYFRPFFVTALL
jgi:hypothetical protein